MKALKVLFVAVFSLVSFNTFAQSNAKVIAVVNQAEWCGTCEKHGGRFMSEVVSQYKAPQVTIANNVLTDEKTIASSKKELEALGVYGLVADEKKTGLLILIDNKTKKVISKTSLAKPTEELKAAFDKAIKQS